MKKTKTFTSEFSGLYHTIYKIKNGKKCVYRWVALPPGIREEIDAMEETCE